MTETNAVHNTNSVPWAEDSPRARSARNDLIVKEVALAILYAANLAALGFSVAYIILYAPPIPATAIICSPFIAGALAAMTHLDVPTMGITRGNYSDWTNPLTMAGKVTAYILFGPTILCYKHFDWTNYSDPMAVDSLSHFLENRTFEEIVDKHEKRIGNFFRYGIMPKEKEERLQNRVKEFVLDKRTLDFLKEEYTLKKAGKKKEDETSNTNVSEEASTSEESETAGEASNNNVPESIATLDGKLKEHEASWNTFKNELELPHPKFPDPDMSTYWSRFRLNYIRHYTNF